MMSPSGVHVAHTLSLVVDIFHIPGQMPCPVQTLQVERALNLNLQVLALLLTTRVTLGQSQLL